MADHCPGCRGYTPGFEAECPGITPDQEDGSIAVYSSGPPGDLLKYAHPVCADCGHQGVLRSDGACARCASATGLIGA